MQTTVKRLPVGSEISFGKYSANKNMEPTPIIWLKANKDGDVIAKSAVDYLCFDALEDAERDGGIRYRVANENYRLSNIHSFLNSCEDEWYVPTHERDNAPTQSYRDVNGQSATYTDHYGFLKCFEDFELNSMIEQTYQVDGEELHSIVRLPTVADVSGATKFNLFKRKGVRIHPSRDLYANKMRIGYGMEQFVPYFLADRESRYRGYVKFLDRTGYVGYTNANYGQGIRPVCRLNLDAKVEDNGNGAFVLCPFEVSPLETGTDDEIMKLLGLVRPQ